MKRKVKVNEGQTVFKDSDVDTQDSSVLSSCMRFAVNGDKEDSGIKKPQFSGASEAQHHPKA